MILKKFEELPEKMQNAEVRKYYGILGKKKVALLLKRMADVFFAVILLVVLLPIFLVIALWIKLDSKGPIFFRQERVTQYGKRFRIFKFRTMVQDAEKNGSLVTLKTDSRITNVGKWIRKVRLDEIPQLINVLLGDMTFVGTRPEVLKYVECYTDEMMATLLLPAGITSRASVEYKNEDKILVQKVEEGKTIDQVYVEDVLPKKMEINLKYIEELSVWTDLKICLRTGIEVIKK